MVGTTGSGRNVICREGGEPRYEPDHAATGPKTRSPAGCDENGPTVRQSPDHVYLDMLLRRVRQLPIRVNLRAQALAGP
jgi:hypothetical protein